MTEKAPEVDQDGKMINPHNPDFITKVPWYLGNHGPTLKHHNIQKKDHLLSLNEADQLIEQKILAQKVSALSAPKASGFRKGACKNCGSMTHKEKDCLERPRSTKKSAWKTGVDIAPDEVVVNLEDHGKLSYAAKRDQWKGYDPKEYEDIMQRHERIQEQKQAQRLAEQAQKEALASSKQQTKKDKKKRKKGGMSDEDKERTSDETGGSEESDSGSDYDSDEDSDDEDGINNDETKEFLANDDQIRDFQGTIIPQGGIGGNGMRVTVRNLRDREDTPKYLRNLSLDSAFYDPKSRSMRANPFPNANPEDVPFAGDNFIRYSGDAIKLAQNQVLCWEMQERGESIDIISNPSQAELLHRQFTEKKTIVENTKKKAILDKYTDGKANPSLDPRLRLGQTEAYLEYTKDGKLAKDIVAPATKTKYEEDVYINNHTSVWGSYYSRMQGSWGYACCHSVLKNSFCVGAKGFETKQPILTGKPREATEKETNQTQISGNSLANKPVSGSTKSGSGIVSRSDLYGESNSKVSFSDDKVKEKLAKVRQQDQEDGNNSSGARKRSYNSMQSSDVTPEDMEVYRLTKVKAEDPMAKYLAENQD